MRSENWPDQECRFDRKAALITWSWKLAWSERSICCKFKLVQKRNYWIEWFQRNISITNSVWACTLVEGWGSVRSWIRNSPLKKNKNMLRVLQFGVLQDAFKTTISVTEFSASRRKHSTCMRTHPWFATTCTNIAWNQGYSKDAISFWNMFFECMKCSCWSYFRVFSMLWRGLLAWYRTITDC